MNYFILKHQRNLFYNRSLLENRLQKTKTVEDFEIQTQLGFDYNNYHLPFLLRKACETLYYRFTIRENILQT